MDFESPDDYPSIFATVTSKKSNDSDYSDDVSEKLSKKDILSKRKEKKDNKKDRGYAALEGESSAEEDHEGISTKSKKSKSFKFTTKNKDKREKVKEREVEKKKEKDKKCDRSKDKLKVEKKDRKVKNNDEKGNIAEGLPIFSVSLQLAVERSHCHDGVDLPLPVRECIDYIIEEGINTENIYKISGIKAKVLHIKKMYNQREPVILSEYDVPTATSVLKLFIRELPEPILGDLVSRFEEAGAIQDVTIRETNLISLVEKLPNCNRTLVAWTMLHLDIVANNHRINKMNAQSLANVLSPVLQMSHRLLVALWCHCKTLFRDTKLFRYHPPLTSISNLPEEMDDIILELKKQESLLSQIHTEMNSGFISKTREELLWEVQRMITQMKRKLRSIQKYHETPQRSVEEETVIEHPKLSSSLSFSDDDNVQTKTMKSNIEPASNSTTVDTSNFNIEDNSNTVFVNSEEKPVVLENEEVQQTMKDSTKLNPSFENPDIFTLIGPTNKPHLSSIAVGLIQHENNALIELKDSLLSQIDIEKSEIELLKFCLNTDSQQNLMKSNSFSNIDFDKLDEITDLIKKENRILQIKKIDLIREIMEHREACIYLQSKLSVLSNTSK